MKLFAVLALFLMFTSPIHAQDWQRLGPGEIEPALLDRSVIYEAAWQKFYASGRTLYDSGQPSWGYWREHDGQYCSQWPPSGGWDCFNLQINRAGTQIRFIDAFGNKATGNFQSN